MMDQTNQTDSASGQARTIYNDACKNMLTLLMWKPAARQEFRSAFADLNLADVFPPFLTPLAQWTLSVDYPITISMVEQRTDIAFVDEFAGLGPLDATPQGIISHVEAFVALFQTDRLVRLGFNVNPDLPVLDQIERLVSEITSLGQRRIQVKDARGDLRFRSARERIENQGGQGFRPLGIKQLDDILPGLNYEDGDMGIIMAKRKSDKTRLAMNLALRALIANEEIGATWLSTEPFSSPESIMMSMWAMLSVREAGKGAIPWDCADTLVHKAEKRFTEPAAELLEQLGKRIFVYGPALEDGNTAQLASAVSIMIRNLSILGHKFLVIDNFQQFVLPGSHGDNVRDYELMLAVTRALSTVAAQHKVVMIGISQVSQQGSIKGGGGMDDRSAWALRPKRKPDSGYIDIHCEYARKAPSPFEVSLLYAPFSGWIRE